MDACDTDLADAGPVMVGGFDVQCHEAKWAGWKGVVRSAPSPQETHHATIPFPAVVTTIDYDRPVQFRHPNAYKICWSTCTSGLPRCKYPSKIIWPIKLPRTDKHETAMLPKSLQILLDRLPRNAEAPKAREAFRQVALDVLAVRLLATDIAEYLRQCTNHDDQADRLMQLLSFALDQARMAEENGKAVGSQFILWLEGQLARLKQDGALTSAGRLFLASCWGRAGLDAPEAVAADFSMFENAEGAFEYLDAAEMGSLIDTLMKEVSGGEDGDLSALHAVFSEIIAPLPHEVRGPMVQQAVARPRPMMGELGCALLFDRCKEIRHGAIQVLMDLSTEPARHQFEA